MAIWPQRTSKSSAPCACLRLAAWVQSTPMHLPSSKVLPGSRGSCNEEHFELGKMLAKMERCLSKPLQDISPLSEPHIPGFDRSGQAGNLSPQASLVSPAALVMTHEALRSCLKT
eukprot:2262711-Amphidinium_carterae.1